jgi:multiple sugar transport system permease protein
MSRVGAGHAARTAGFYSSSTVLAVLFLFPLVWTLFSSVHGHEATNGASQNGFGLANYRRLFDYGAGIGTYLLNSAVVSVITVVLTVAIATLGGYAIARFRFRGRNLLFLVTLAILMVPYTTILIPLYVFLGWIHLQDSLIGLALVLVVFQLPFGLFMMRNSFESLPVELEEAALIDGCGSVTALFRVLLRCVAPGLVTVGLFAFLASWNEFAAPLIFLTDGSKFTLPLALFDLQSGNENVVDFGALQSGVVIAAVPCIVIFLALQRFYVRGFTSGAIKG